MTWHLIIAKASTQNRSLLAIHVFLQNLIIITWGWEMLFCNRRDGAKNPVVRYNVLKIHFKLPLSECLHVWKSNKHFSLCWVWIYTVEHCQIIHSAGWWIIIASTGSRTRTNTCYFNCEVIKTMSNKNKKKQEKTQLRFESLGSIWNQGTQLRTRQRPQWRLESICQNRWMEPSG